MLWRVGRRREYGTPAVSRVPKAIPLRPSTCQGVGGHALRVMGSGPGIGKPDIPAGVLCHLPAAGGG